MWCPHLVDRHRLAPQLQGVTAMRIALPTWNGRISPIFDEARHLRVVEIGAGVVTLQSDHDLENGNRIDHLTRLGVDVLVCAAICWPTAAVLHAAGIEVISEVCGPTDEIVRALCNGSKDLRRFLSPGCPDRDHHREPR